jgi:allophanate hydrolase subunit 2
MGSSSFDELSQIGTPPIKLGNEFEIDRKVAGSIAQNFAPGSTVTVDATVELAAMPAPRWGGFSKPEQLFSSEYEVTSSVNRVGLRLSGPELIWSSKTRLASEGVVTGAIQIPVDGMPLIFGPDHPTTAGYPVIAVVSRNALDVLAQAAPGTKVRFKRTR